VERLGAGLLALGAGVVGNALGISGGGRFKEAHGKEEKRVK